MSSAQISLRPFSSTTALDRTTIPHATSKIDYAQAREIVISDTDEEATQLHRETRPKGLLPS